MPMGAWFVLVLLLALVDPARAQTTVAYCSYKYNCEDCANSRESGTGASCLWCQCTDQSNGKELNSQCRANDQSCSTACATQPSVTGTSPALNIIRSASTCATGCGLHTSCGECMSTTANACNWCSSANGTYGKCVDVEVKSSKDDTKQCPSNAPVSTDMVAFCPVASCADSSDSCYPCAALPGCSWSALAGSCVRTTDWGVYSDSFADSISQCVRADAQHAHGGCVPGATPRVTANAMQFSAVNDGAIGQVSCGSGERSIYLIFMVFSIVFTIILCLWCHHESKHTRPLCCGTTTPHDVSMYYPDMSTCLRLVAVPFFIIMAVTIGFFAACDSHPDNATLFPSYTTFITVLLFVACFGTCVWGCVVSRMDPRTRVEIQAGTPLSERRASRRGKAQFRAQLACFCILLLLVPCFIYAVWSVAGTESSSPKRFSGYWYMQKPLDDVGAWEGVKTLGETDVACAAVASFVSSSLRSSHVRDLSDNLGRPGVLWTWFGSRSRFTRKQDAVLVMQDSRVTSGTLSKTVDDGKAVKYRHFGTSMPSDSPYHLVSEYSVVSGRDDARLTWTLYGSNSAPMRSAKSDTEHDDGEDDGEVMESIDRSPDFPICATSGCNRGSGGWEVIDRRTNVEFRPSDEHEDGTFVRTFRVPSMGTPTAGPEGGEYPRRTQQRYRTFALSLEQRDRGDDFIPHAVHLRACFDCVACTAGKAKPDAGVAACTPCGAGQSGSDRFVNGTTRRTEVNSSVGDTACVPCSSGQFASSHGQAKCVPCATGQSQPSTGSVACVPCATGQQANAGNVACENCPQGHFNSGTGRQCDGCSAGLFHDGDTGATSDEVCKPCGPGQYSSAGSPTCSFCPRSTFSSGARSDCTECDAGLYTISEGMTNNTCKPCGPGSFRGKGGGMEACAGCLPGSWSLGGGERCTRCVAGKFLSQSGGSARSLCEVCPKGTFAPGVFEVGSRVYIDYASSPANVSPDGENWYSQLTIAGEPCDYVAASFANNCNEAGTTNTAFVVTVAAVLRDTTDGLPVVIQLEKPRLPAAVVKAAKDAGVEIGVAWEFENPLLFLSDNCTFCPIGTYNNVTGATSASACEHCGVGHRGTVVGASDYNGTCQQCDSTSYTSEEGVPPRTMPAEADAEESETAVGQCTPCRFYEEASRDRNRCVWSTMGYVFAVALWVLFLSILSCFIRQCRKKFCRCRCCGLEYLALKRPKDEDIPNALLHGGGVVQLMKPVDFSMDRRYGESLKS